MQDEEFEALLQTPERIKALGFKPQKEILLNHLLPYANELDEESSKFLELVKINFSKSVILREMKPACGMWSSRLMKYIRIYGFKFGKEDHIALIKLTYELVLIPDLEPCKIHKYATLFLMLTKKRYLLTPEELTLPWRPLYDVGKKIFDKSATHYGMYHYLPHLEGSFVAMVKCARPYFEISATQEILEECLPQINPCSTDSHLVTTLAAFLPVSLHPKDKDRGHGLWFDKLMELWECCYNSQCGTADLMTLFAGLAKKNPGAVDWSPYVSKMFTRFLHALNLPVSYKDMQYTRNHNLDTKSVATWIIWSICSDGVTLKHLRSFLAAIESYLHSVNSGRWTFRLRDLLRKLAREFLNRVRREREPRFQTGWENQSPETYRLRDEDITEFVKIMLDPTLQAVYSRGGSLDISLALQNLANLRPAMVIPPLLDRLKTTLTSLTEPHRVTAAMSAVASVARPMLRGADADYPEGPTHVVPLLLAILPGLDPNDIKKTLVSLHFILMFCWMVPLIDCSSAVDYYDDLTEEELITCELTAQFEDFVLVFLDRIFIIIESSVQEQARLDTKDSEQMRSKMDAVMETAISSAATAVLMQCSPKIFKEALRKFKSFATESTYETSVSGSIIGILLRSFARIDSVSTLAAFVPKLCEELTELLATDEALHEEIPSRDLSYRLLLLMHALECDATVLLKYIPTILPVLDRALKLHCTSTLNRASEILSHILTTFCYISLNECRGSPNDYSTAPEKWLPVRDWGKGCSLQDANFSWHVPSAEEAECAQMLVNRYLKPEVERLKQWLSGERAMCRSRRLRCFTIMRAVLACSTFLPPSDEEPLYFCESQLAPASVKFANGVRYSVNLDGANLRVALTRLLVEVQARLLDDRTDDTRGLEMLIQVWNRVVVVRGSRSGPGLEARLRSFAALERALDGRGEVGGGGAGALRLRMLVAEGVRLQEDARSDLALVRGVTPSIMHALNALYDLSVHHYTVVRIQAQAHLYWILSHYSYIYRALVPKLVDLLEKGGDGEDWHDRHKGALCILLGPRCGPLIAKQDWEAVSKLWLAVLKSPLSEKASIIRLENAFSDTLHRNFPTMNTRLTVSEGAVRAAEALLALSSAPPITLDPADALETERITSLHTETVYTKMIEDIVAICETPNIQWRRLELAMQMLIRCPSLQTFYPPALVRFSLRSLLHENIVVRRLAMKLVQFVLKQRKRPIKKIKVDPYEIAGVSKKTSHVPGYREDLDWTLWSDEVPETDEEYEKPWLRNDNYGFYCWPEKLEVAAPSNEQVFSFNISKEEMEAGERMIHEWFSDEENVTKLISFLIVEDKKGKDKFNSTKFSMFRLLFSQFGMEVSHRLLSEAKECAASSQEASQRFAAEVAAAALRAPHYWPRDLARPMYAAALDIITAGLKSVTAETMEDWGTCLATGAEKLCVRRGAFVVRTLIDVCLPQEASGALDATAPTSFVVCARLYALHGVLSSLSWRAAPLATKILEQLEAANFTQHPFQNVRETVSSLLMTIFDTELVFPNGQLRGPSLKSFLDTVTPRLAPLYDENGDIVIRTAAALSTSSECGRSEEPVAPDLELGNPLVESVGAVGAVDPVGPVQVEVGRLSPINDDAPEGDERETKTAGRAARVPALGEGLEAAMALAGDASLAHRENARAVNLLTTVFRACTGSTVRGVAGARGAHATLVAAACALAARGPAHDEVARAADGFLASLALAFHSSEDFLHLLDHLEKLAVGRSWWARVACVDLAQPLIFYALPLLCEHPDAAERTQRFALTLMRDSRLEVRQSAAKLLTGLMHCRALPDETATLRGLMKSCRSKQLVERHCGVLGLCSYLSSRPYSLGPKLGEVLNELSRHTHASDPIPATIRTALADFRRTHHDDWPTHRQQLTEDELDLLADLTSPPTYCA